MNDSALRNLQSIKSKNTTSSDVLYEYYWFPRQSHPTSLLAPKRGICNLTQTLSALYSVYLLTPAQTLPIPTCTETQTLTGRRGVEIQPLKCLSIWGNTVWSWEEKGHNRLCRRGNGTWAFLRVGSQPQNVYSLDGVWSNFVNTKKRMATVHCTLMLRLGHTTYVWITEELPHLVSFSLNIKD